MADVLTKKQRSACMRAVRGKNTGPEMRVRRLAHSMGYRYSLHTQKLPGTPDLVFSSRRKVIFVHGCFWHKHHCRHGSKSPVANSDYWDIKRTRTAQRDKAQITALQKDGWKVLVLWECEISDRTATADRLKGFLG